MQSRSYISPLRAQRRLSFSPAFTLKIRYSERDLSPRSVKIHVKTGPFRKTARLPMVLVPGFTLHQARAILRTLESPLPLFGPARKVREPIDWRICGDQDPLPED